MTLDEAVSGWLNSAERNLETARSMLDSKHYDWALFIGQLSLEKLLKGLVTKTTGEPPPFTHDLVKLALLAGTELTQAQKDELAIITRFHLAARYDDVKEKFYHQATPDFSKKWMETIEGYFLWFKKHY